MLSLLIIILQPITVEKKFNFRLAVNTVRCPLLLLWKKIIFICVFFTGMLYVELTG